MTSLDRGKVHPVMGVCFLTLTAGGTHQLLDPHSCEWEEVYTSNRVYFLLDRRFPKPLQPQLVGMQPTWED